MSSSRGLCSSSLCRSTQKNFRSKKLHDSPHPSPHTSSPPSTKDLLHQGFSGYLLKVRITYQKEYGCSRMGISPPIHHWIFSLLLSSVPFRWLCSLPGLSLSGGEQRINVWYWFISLIPFNFGFDWICFLGLFWQRLFDTHHLDLALLASSWLLAVAVVATTAAAVRKSLGGGGCVSIVGVDVLFNF
ncbi:hypothetical protein RchiOBHm_Chr5g0059251 [Rosa chinensis]|uniref:Transmembrane protein n=1 Tax=Rosa chinensis TaxID=74649 RepID=A0A2P6QHC1_ROSCH|nr:hypothetical protein RchiOBHm_Chr5g0059251 [Rosa chinensis]